MSAITVPGISNAVQSMNQVMTGLEQVLNDADAKLGDGDTGAMLARVIKKMASTDISTAATPGAALVQLAKAATLATGSSLGTLLATGMMAAGKQVNEESVIPVSRLSELLAVARDAMMARGGASLGDKTVLDSLDAISAGLSAVSTHDQARLVAAQAASDALDSFRNRPNRIGRARMFGDQTIGIDDPGMLAIARLTEALNDAHACR